MKICIVAETLLAGGAEWFILRHYKALEQKGHDVSLVVLRPDKIDKRILKNFRSVKKSYPSVLIVKLTVFLDRVLNKLFRKFFFYEQYSYRWLRKKLKKIQPHIIHSHLLAADIIVARANQGVSTKHVITIHGDYLEFIKEKQKKFLQSVSVVLKSVDAVVVITDEQKKLFIQHYPFITQKIKKIYNGYPTENKVYSSYSKNSRPFTFGMIARGIPEKGWDVVVEAVKRINRNDIKLMLFGEGSFLDQLKKNTTDSRVIFAGFTNDPLTAIQEFDVGLFPSYIPTESLPTTIIEYLMLEKPVITTDVGECAKMIEGDEGPAGIVIPLNGAKPDISKWAVAMEALQNDKQFYQFCTLNAASAKTKFEMNKCINSYIELYKNLLNTCVELQA